MKELSIADLIPGTKEHEKFEPIRPKEIFYKDNHYFLNFPDGIAIFTEYSLNESNESFNTFIDSNRLKIAGKTGNILYSVQKEGANFLLYFHKGQTFSIFQYNTQTQKLDKRASKKIGFTPLYPKANSVGEMVFSSSDNRLYLLDNQLNLHLLFESKNEYRIDITPSRDELGITDLVHWSPDHQKIAFYLTDNSKVTEYPLVEINDPMATVKMIKYPMAGGESERTQVGIIDINSKNIAFIDCSKEKSKGIEHQYSYLPCLTWSLDSKHIFLCELERSQQYYQAKQYDVQTGTLVQILFDEKGDRYVEPEHPFLVIDQEQLIFLSQRTGHNHIYRLNLSNKKIDPLTSGDWDVIDIIGKQNGSILFRSTISSPLNKVLNIVDLTSKEISTISNLEGTTEILYFNEKEDKVISYYSNHEGTIDISFNQIKKSILNPYKEYNLPSKKYGYIDKNGEKLYYQITEPRNKGNREKHPVVFYVYGGPHVQLINNRFGSSTKGFEEMMAQEGYYVFCIDPHGSTNRGHQFESAIYQQINRPQIEDYDYALDHFFSTHPDADRQNIAIYGWSFGGYMTISMLLHSRHSFKIGIAGGAVVDWRYYEVMYTERYMGVRSPKTEPFYQQCDLKQYLKNLKSPLYLIHCDNDPVVLWQHTLSLVKVANQKTKNGYLIDYYIYPGHPHNVRGAERLQLMLKIKSLITNRLK